MDKILAYHCLAGQQNNIIVIENQMMDKLRFFYDFIRSYYKNLLVTLF